MKQARLVHGVALESAVAIAEDGQCASFKITPKLFTATGKLVETTGELTILNTGESVSIGDEIIAIQELSGFWVTIQPEGGEGGVIEYKIASTSTKTSGPYTGLKAASVVIHGAPCNRSSLIGTTVEVIDHSNELFDEVSMAGFTGWASEMVFLSLDPEVECDTISPCHWAAINRVCTAATGIYASPCEAATYYVPEGYAPDGYMPVGYV